MLKVTTAGKGLIALDAAGGARLGHRLLDLALRAHADHLEEFADAEVEGFFIHGNSPLNSVA
jgi:hypothetical protein